MSSPEPTGRPARRSGAVPKIGAAPRSDHPARHTPVDDTPPPPPASRPASQTPVRKSKQDDDPLVPFGSRLRRSTHRRLRIYSTINELDIQDITNEAVLEWLDRHEQDD